MRNAPLQESVAATAARACTMALRLYKMLGMETRLMTCLYDSLVSIGPLEERFVTKRIHDVVMSELNTWEYNDEYGKRTLQYGVDTEFNYKWSTHPSKEEIFQLNDPNFHPTPDRLKWLLTFDDWQSLV